MRTRYERNGVGLRNGSTLLVVLYLRNEFCYFFSHCFAEYLDPDNGLYADSLLSFRERSFRESD